MSDAPREIPAPPKEDPETLVLRGSPRPVVRFRRGLIIGITGAVAAALVTVTWVALEPPSFRIAAGEDQGAEPLSKAAPEALADAPASYGDVPRLGPPLPGDLGRPILEHQRSMAQEASPTALGAAPSQADSARATAEAERQRRIAAEEAARASGVIVQTSGGGGVGAPTPAAAERGQNGEGEGAAGPPASTGGSPAGQARRGEFGRSEAGDTNPYPLRPAPSPWTLSAGTIIPASLVTGLNSDLPGTVIAQVTENVRDSATGRTILVPQGARLIGSYDSAVAYGQRRALLVWQRIVFPDGSSIRLDNAPATDLSGFSGVEDGVDFHTWRLLKGIALSTLLGVGTELTFGSGEGDLVRAVRESTQQNAARGRSDHLAQPQRTADSHGSSRLAAARRDPQGSGASALEGMMGGLRLARLPDRTPVKITIAVAPDLHQALADYAELYRETYGQEEPVQDLIPAMLAAFIESDRSFGRRRRSGG